MKNQTETCAKCGSEKIITEAYLTDYESGGVCLAVDEDPKNFFKKTVVSDINIKVCGDCGFVEFFAAEAAKLYQAFLNSKKKSSDKKPNLFSI